MSETKIAHLLLRIGLSFALVYAAIGGLLNPNAWIGFAPVWILRLIPENIFLLLFGAVEVLLAALLLFMKRPFYPALIAAALLLGMVVFNLGAIDIVFRDVSLALMAFALAVLSNKKDYA